MGTRTTYRTSQRLLDGMVTTLKDRMAHVLLRIHMDSTSCRHRLGSWEELASFHARALSRKTEKGASTQ